MRKEVEGGVESQGGGEAVVEGREGDKNQHAATTWAGMVAVQQKKAGRMEVKWILGTPRPDVPPPLPF